VQNTDTACTLKTVNISNSIYIQTMKIKRS